MSIESDAERDEAGEDGFAYMTKKARVVAQRRKQRANGCYAAGHHLQCELRRHEQRRGRFRWSTASSSVRECNSQLGYGAGCVCRVGARTPGSCVADPYHTGTMGTGSQVWNDNAGRITWVRSLGASTCTAACTNAGMVCRTDTSSTLWEDATCVTDLALRLGHTCTQTTDGSTHVNPQIWPSDPPSSGRCFYGDGKTGENDLSCDGILSTPTTADRLCPCLNTEVQARPMIHRGETSAVISACGGTNDVHWVLAEPHQWCNMACLRNDGMVCDSTLHEDDFGNTACMQELSERLTGQTCTEQGLALLNPRGTRARTRASGTTPSRRATSCATSTPIRAVHSDWHRSPVPVQDGPSTRRGAGGGEVGGRGCEGERRRGGVRCGAGASAGS